VKTRLNLEMAAVEDLVATALNVKPDMVTLVPEKRQEVTTESGLDVIHNREHYEKTTKTLQEAGIWVSFFIDPEPSQIQESSDAGANIVEIHTGPYSDAKSESERLREFKRISEAAKIADGLKLGVHAGHGLNYVNIKAFSAIPEIQEYSIGHSIIARAVMVGMDRAVREMIDLICQF